MGIGFFAVRPAFAQLSRTINQSLAYGTIVGWGTQDLRVTIMIIIQVLLGFLGVIAVLIILYAGWRWMTSGGDPQKIQDAKRTLMNAVLGLLIIFSAFALVAFIIRMLSGAAGPQGGTRQPPPTLPCTNCEVLGSGIIEAVYPTPGATDVPRNTSILVTFKLLMDRNTIIQNIGGTDRIKNVSIQAWDSASGSWGPALGDDAVSADSSDNLTFTFHPDNPIGSEAREMRYQVSLGCGIKRQDGPDAFPRCLGSTGYAWSFTVGTRLDLTPPTLDSVFPEPDDNKDGYNQVDAVAATGGVKVLSRPHTSQPARVEDLLKFGASPVATFAGTNYNCAQDNLVCVRYVGAPTNRFRVNPKVIGAADCNGTADVQGGWLVDGIEAGNSVVLGCGITLGFTGGIAAAKVDGNLWNFRAYASRAADTLRIGVGSPYKFVPATPGAGEIEVGTPTSPRTAAQIAANIANVLNGSVESPDVTAGIDAGDNTKVNLTAANLGVAGNRITVTASGSWAGVTQFSGGRDASFQQAASGAPDVARNAVPRMDYSEGMLPGPITGTVTVDDAADGIPGNNVGSLAVGIPPPYATVQADLDDNGFENHEYVGGTYIISNQYQAVEFQSASLCGQCSDNGAPCTKAGDCTGAGATCELVRNSCGDQVFCLPTVQPAAGNEAGTTRYQMTVRAATLYACDATHPCRDNSFPTCTGGVCKSKDGSVNYPYSDVKDGALDLALNSLDGNRVNGAQGPGASPYDLNDPLDTTRGDSVKWTFWVNNRLELKPPRINNTDGIFPGISSSGVLVTAFPAAQFDKVLMSSSLKPDQGYRDGRCYCRVNSDCQEAKGEVCDNGAGGSNTCRQTAGRDNFCVDSKECKLNSCLVQQHVALIDYACSTSGRCSGWWIGNVGHDTPPLDGYPNFTEVTLGHTPFAEYSQYAVEMGSGIRDQYQNCYLPSEGPNAAGTDCGANRNTPYCCDGVPSANPCP